MSNKKDRFLECVQPLSKTNNYSRCFYSDYSSYFTLNKIKCGKENTSSSFCKYCKETLITD